jgi:DNA mismatch repair protein MSH6
MHMDTLVDDEKHEVRETTISPSGLILMRVVSIQLVFLYKLVEGIASSSFGTHVASLAGVPTEVVDRADSVSKDFARQFKEKIEGKKKQTRLPLVAQADFAYLYGIATGKYSLPDNKVRQKEVLRGLKQAVKMCLAGNAPK